MNERIREFLLAENKSSAQLAEEIGVQPSGISHILSGRNNPSLDFVLKMLEKYQFLSTDWLLFGVGSMYKDQKRQTLFDEIDMFDENKKQAGVKNEAQNISTVMKDMNKENDEGHDNLQHRDKDALVKKIVWFYSDNSYEEYYPRH